MYNRTSITNNTNIATARDGLVIILIQQSRNIAAYGEFDVDVLVVVDIILRSKIIDRIVLFLRLWVGLFLLVLLLLLFFVIIVSYCYINSVDSVVLDIYNIVY